MKITIKRKDFEEIVSYAKDHLPEEACGLLAGSVSGEEKHIEKVYFLENTDHSMEHFSLNPKEQFAAVKDMRQAGLSPIGNWHSHPESPSRPSEEDIRLAFDGSASYLILSLMDINEPVLNAFTIKYGQVQKDELEII